MSYLTGKYNVMPLSWINTLAVLAFIATPIAAAIGHPFTALMTFNLGLYLNLVVLIRERT